MYFQVIQGKMTSGVKYYFVSLVIIISLSLVLRISLLNSNPPGLYVDDAAIGYNAYSLGVTGKDEYGQFLPIFLRSFGSFTPALIVYYAILPIKIFGLEIWALRLTPALLGTATVIVFAVFCARLFKSWSKPAFLLGGLLFSLCPQLILFHRGFYESPLSLLFFLLGLIYLLRFHYLSGLLFFSLSSYAYHSQRLIIYLFIIIYSLFYHHQILDIPKKKIILYLSIFILTQLPQVYLSTQPGPSQRFLNRTWIPDIRAKTSSTGKFITASLREFSSQFISYYNPRNIFWSPDPDPQRSIPELSIYYPWLVIPYLMGLVILFKRHSINRFIFPILLVTPVSAALTKDPFSVLRASLTIIPISLIILLGIQKINKILLVICLLLSSLFFLYRCLFILLPNERYIFWSYGYQSAFSYFRNSPLPLLVDADKPVYILYLFYEKISPQEVQSFSPNIHAYYSQLAWSNYYETRRIRFARINWEHDMCISQIILASPLAISSTQAAEHYLTKIYTVFSPQGDIPVMVAFQTHPALKCPSP